MLTQDLHNQPQTGRSVTIPFYFAVSVVLLICAMLAVGATVLSTTDKLEKSPRLTVTDWAKNTGWQATTGVRIREAVLKLPARYVSSIRFEPDLPTLVIDIKFKHQEALRSKRQAALELRNLIQEEGDLVPADIRIGDRQVKVRLRLKGDQMDHLDSEKWSLRIEVSGDDHILGMRRFSLQHPKVRGYHAEPVFMETLRHSGVLGVRYQFVHVIVNGEAKGIMALEEHFSKELLEHQARREGVFLRFDEANFWDYQTSGGNWMNSPYDSFRNSRIRTFSTRRVLDSPAMSAQYQAGVGLLRGFAANQITASDAFDVETTASYLAALELWGSWHGIQWNDIRFYMDPLTMKLEPIGYDAHPQLHSDIQAITSKREPIFTALLQDPLIRSEYVARLRELCRDVVDGELGTKLAALQEDLLTDLRYEFLLLEPMDLSKLFERAQFLLELDDDDLLQAPVTFPRRVRYPALLQANLINKQTGQYLEMANLLFEPVTVTSIQWRNPETLASTPAESVEGYELPFELPPTIAGESPNFRKLNLLSRPEGPDTELVITARYAHWPHETDIRPLAYYEPVTVNPVPKALLSEQLMRHPYLEREEANDVLTIRRGQWQVESDIFIPSGFTLSVEPGAVLEFAPEAALVSNGALRLVGVEDEPVTLRGIGGGDWQGVAVLQADGKSILRHVKIEDTRGVARDSWQLTGGVTFYHSDVDFEDVSISRHGGEDALNIIRSKFNIVRLDVSDAISDAFDADFTTGTIRDSKFASIGGASGGDALDFSGSEIVVDGIRFQGVADKALSVGEGSRVRASNLVMTHVGTAAASKDGSHLDIDGLVINDVVFAGLMAYIKKPEYGPASIKAENVLYKPSGPVGRVQTGSLIELDGAKLPSEDLDVDLLYETVMRKGS